MALSESGEEMNRVHRLALAAMVAGSGVFLTPAMPASAASYPTCNGWGVKGSRSVAGEWARVPIYWGSSDPQDTWDCVMGVGAQSDAVGQLQRTLNRCYSAGLVVDGIFGNRTRSALRAAQSAAGASPDGVYGPQTRRLIKHARSYPSDTGCTYVW